MKQTILGNKQHKHQNRTGFLLRCLRVRAVAVVKMAVGSVEFARRQAKKESAASVTSMTD